MPTYFTGAYGDGSQQALLKLPSGNVSYLGRAGVKTIAGLQLAFLDGMYDADSFSSDQQKPGMYTKEDVDLLKHQLEQGSGDIDVLLTHEWPQGLESKLSKDAMPNHKGSSLVAAELALIARPRYHIAAGFQTFYTRPPYLNPDLGAGSHATRFIALGNVGNTKKQKWLHALSLTPASEMSPEVLQTAPPGTTPCPYHVSDRKRPMFDEGDTLDTQEWRWQNTKRQKFESAAPSLGRQDIVKDKNKTAFVRNVPFAATEDEIREFFTKAAGPIVDIVRRTNKEGKLNSYCHIQFENIEGMEKACHLHGTVFMGRTLTVEPASTFEEKRNTHQPNPHCWFCLSNPNADTQLVVSVGDECYLALDKGAITDGHVLILPVEHYASALSTSPGIWAEIERYISALKSCYASTGKSFVGFERYMTLRKSGGNHCHVNAIAVPAMKVEIIKTAFEDIAQRHGFSLHYLPPTSGEEAKQQLKEVVGEGEYFVGLLPDGSRLVHSIAYGERHPLSYGREVLAHLVKAPERADWKICAVSPNEEIARCDAFKGIFSKYDIMSNS